MVYLPTCIMYHKINIGHICYLCIYIYISCIHRKASSIHMFVLRSFLNTILYTYTVCMYTVAFGSKRFCAFQSFFSQICFACAEYRFHHRPILLRQLIMMYCVETEQPWNDSPSQMILHMFEKSYTIHKAGSGHRVNIFWIFVCWV